MKSYKVYLEGEEQPEYIKAGTVVSAEKKAAKKYPTVSTFNIQCCPCDSKEVEQKEKMKAEERRKKVEAEDTEAAYKRSASDTNLLIALLS
jgi:hypothetical protein